MNDPKKVSSTWVKHLYGLVDKLNNTERKIIGMSPKDAIKLKEVNLIENCSPEDTLHEDGCIVTSYNPEKNTTTNVKEQWVENGIKSPTDL